MSPYIEVAIGRLARLFHYQLPPAIGSRPIQPGTRLLVPFGPRVAIAYFIRYVETPSVSQTKEVLAVFDPLLPIPLIKLLQWISEYYCAPIGAVILGALPPKGQSKTFRRFELTEAGRSVLAPIRSAAAEEMIRLLSKKASTEVSLRRTMGTTNFTTALSLLKRRGWVKSTWEVSAPTFKEATPPSSTDRSENPFVPDPPHRLNADQKAAYDALVSALSSLSSSGTAPVGTSVPFLLHGVTGSGKTEVYLHLIEEALRQNRGAIVLVPEIGLTPQLVARFQGRFGKTVAALHSGLSPKERYDAWRRIRDRDARIAIGARSALFAPMDHIGVIIIDEEHDPSYKQDESVRYHARDAAVVYGKLVGAVVVLGSATPSLESFYNAKTGKYRLLSLPTRVEARPNPSIDIIDLREKETWVKPFITQKLHAAIAQRLAHREQVILFVNRRGHTPSLLCGDCGHRWGCAHCSVALTFHKKTKRLLCHYCGFHRPAPAACPTCHGARLLYLGIGTEQLEESIRSLFPAARVLRMDRDTTSRKGVHHRIMTAMEGKEADILIGTQMVAKGHDFPGVTLVGIICADLALNFADFRASERTFQLLSQVAGRSGRGEQRGEVLIQTFQPLHDLFRVLPDYETFYHLEKQYRAEADYPPFNRVILLLLCHKNESIVADWAERLTILMKKNARGVDLLGPAPAQINRLRGEYRYQILLKGNDRTRLKAVLKNGLDVMQSANPKRVRVIVDVDPQHLL